MNEWTTAWVVCAALFWGGVGFMSIAMVMWACLIK